MLATVLHQSSVPILIAHVNYGLRGDESRRDEAFVRSWAEQRGLPFFLLSAHEEMRSEGNIQARARAIRYTWFRELMTIHGASAICVAHHLDDQVETLIHQFMRGGGPRTLLGMQEFQDFIFRPFLNAPRELIASAASEWNVCWVEDSSNASSDYTRNTIRHQLRDAMLAVNPGLDEALLHRADVMREWLEFAETALEKELSQHLQSSIGEEWLSTTWLTSHSAPRLVLHAWLHKRGFNSDEAIKLLHANAGARINSGDLVLWRERERMLLSGLDVNHAVECNIHEKAGTLNLPHGNLVWSCGRVDDADELDAWSIAVDLEEHPFPWTIRSWRPGDRFQPLGMQGTQTVGDFLTHRSLAVRERSHVLLLEVSEEVAWIMGHRVSERFRFKNFGKTAIRFQYSPLM